MADRGDRRTSAPAPWADEALVRALADSVEPCVCVQDVEGRLLFVNRSFCRWVGRTEIDLIGRSGDTWSFAWGEKEAHALASVLASARPEQGEVAGQVRPVRVPLRDARGALTGMLTVFRPVPDAPRGPVRLDARGERSSRETVHDSNNARSKLRGAGHDPGTSARSHASLPPAPLSAALPPLAIGPRWNAVLLLESNASVLRMTQLILERGGLPVVSFSRAADGLDWLRGQPGRASVVLLDQHLVGGPDARTAREATSVSPGSRVLLNCVCAPGDLLPEARSYIWGLLRKPYDADQLLRTVRAALRRAVAPPVPRPGSPTWDCSSRS